MNLKQLSDRFAIRDLIVRYANALDSRSFEWLDEIFTADAYIDYRATGGIDGDYAKIREWLPPATGAFPHMCHLVGNIAVTIDGDRARARTLCLNPVEVPMPAGGSQVMFLAMWYAGRAPPHRRRLAHDPARAGGLHPAQRAAAPDADARLRRPLTFQESPRTRPCSACRNSRTASNSSSCP